MSGVGAPRNVVPRVRDYRFGRSTAPNRWWLDGDPIATAIFDGLSATFPHGERFFMDSLRRYRDAVPDDLRDQITIFITQEAMHTREHVAFNNSIAIHGRDFDALNARSEAVVSLARMERPLDQLAATAALEHFTAVLGHVVLANPRYLKGANAEIASLWRWHSLEEIEHKAVAFDTLIHVLRTAPAWRRWLFRSGAMFKMTRLFTGPSLGNITQILRDDGVSKSQTYLGLIHYLLISPGLLWQAAPLCLAYYLPGFHPWKLDDSQLLIQADHDLATG